MTYYWRKLVKWINTPKGDRPTKLSLIVMIIILLLGAAGSAFAGGSCPATAPTNPAPAPTTYSTTSSNDGDIGKYRGLAISAVLIGAAVCIYYECWKEAAPVASQPGDSASIVPASANPKQYGISTEVSFQ